MTRANINYIYQNDGECPTTLYHYQNGDQYPSGIRDQFNILDFINSDWSIEAFTRWLGENYKVPRRVKATTGLMTIEYNEDSSTPATPTKITHPCIYYDDQGFPTDYTYVFDSCNGKDVFVYNWGEQIFKGNNDEFIKWIKKQND